jgi:hypothetical protein
MRLAGYEKTKKYKKEIEEIVQPLAGSGNYYFVSDDSTFSDFGSLGWADWQVSGLKVLEKKYHTKISDDEKIVDVAKRFHYQKFFNKN